MVEFDKLITTQEAAKRLHMSESHLRLLCRQAKITAFKLSPRNWRVDADSLVAFAESRANLPNQPELLGGE